MVMKKIVKGKSQVKSLKRSNGGRNGKNVYAGTGISKAEDAYAAGKEAVEMAIKKCGKAPNFGVVFCSGSKYGKDDKTAARLVKGAHEAFMAANPKCKWIGCTTAGEISNYGVTERSCIALSLASEYIHIGVGIGDGVYSNPTKAGKQSIASGLKDLKSDKYLSPYMQFMARKTKKADQLIKMNPYSILLLTPGAGGKYPGMDSTILSAIFDIVGSHIPIIGGAAADDYLFEQSYQFANGKYYKNAAVMGIFSLDLEVTFGVEHGYIPTNKVAIVTEVKGKLITKLNGKPAASVYEKLTGFTSDEVKGKNVIDAGTKMPFAIIGNEGKYWIKSPQMELDSSLLFFADIPKNTLLVLMKASDKNVYNAGKKAIESGKTKNDLAVTFLFDCAGRKLYLRKNVAKEGEVMKEATKGAPFIGFYTYGEFGYSNKTTSNLVNETVVAFNITNRLITEK